MLKELFEYGVRKAIDWYFRVRSPQALLIAGGTGLLLAVIAGPPLIELVLRMGFGAVPEQYRGFAETLNGLKVSAMAIASLMILSGILLIFLKRSDDKSAISSKRVLVVEARGLRLDKGTPLLAALGEEFAGQKVETLIDLCNREDGKALEPSVAISEIETGYKVVQQNKKSMSAADLKVVYGGLAPVPFTFLMGVLFDDEGEIITYDWDRTVDGWRALSDDDDGAQFTVEGMDGEIEGTEAVVAISYSYPVSDDAISNTFAMPVVRLTLDGLSSDAHWSQAKQSRLAQQFFEVVKQLSAKGIKRIHLVLAAPNSVVFTFGRRYDKRNLPAVSVYQFEGGDVRTYPWSIAMPVSDTDRANVSTAPDRNVE
ncbi:MAG: SAVED domain-containing protein [Rhodobacteraceae bacterium]|nr:SAVED domain-containing protein [Paracoccaceae bacterium]